MRYVTSAERIGMRKGLENGIEKGKAEASDLERWADRTLSASSLEALFSEELQ